MRHTKVAESEILRHYSCIALPQMQDSKFLLVLCSMYQRISSFQKCIITCKSSINGSPFADALSTFTQQQVETAARHLLKDEPTNNPVLKKSFSSIKGHCSSVAHSNEASTTAHQKLFSMWHYFGAPVVVVTFTPCDECSFRVRLYVISKEHKVPSIDCIEDAENVCLILI